jgi:hypothetical protein
MTNAMQCPAENPSARHIAHSHSCSCSAKGLTSGLDLVGDPMTLVLAPSNLTVSFGIVATCAPATVDRGGL